jgi:hypothetical protein
MGNADLRNARSLLRGFDNVVMFAGPKPFTFATISFNRKDRIEHKENASSSLRSLRSLRLIHPGSLGCESAAPSNDQIPQPQFHPADLRPSSGKQSF